MRRHLLASLLPFFLAFAVLLLADAPSANAAPAWQATAPMAANHGVGVAVALPDGDALAFGGSTGGPFDVVERYDAEHDSWSTVASLPVGLTSEQATLLRDGRVLITGGSDTVSTGVTSAELYDPASDTWSAAAPMANPRAGHTATLLADGSVLVAGGIGGGTLRADAERYDPATNSWSPAGTLSAGRLSAAATLMPDGTVIVTGGSDIGFAISSADRYDPAANSWSALPEMPRRRAAHTALALPDGDLLVLAGAPGGPQPPAIVATDRFDAATGTWRAVAGRGASSVGAGAVLLGSGLVLALRATDAQIYDPLGDRWRDAGNLTTQHAGSNPLLLADGSALLVGGGLPFGTVGTHDVSERFVPDATPTTAPADFGTQTTGLAGPLLTVPVVARDDVPLFVRGVALEGPDAGDFEIVSDGCAGAALLGQTCFVGVRFTPRADGARTASLVLTGEMLEGRRHVIPLSGVGVAAPLTPPPGPPAPPQPPVPPAQPQPPAGRSLPPSARPIARTAPIVPRVRCGARRGRRVVCTGLPRTLGSGKVRLSRAGIVHATGTLSRGRLTLTVRRRLFDRRYTLVVGGRRAVKIVID